VPSAYAIFLAQFVKQFCIQIATAASTELDMQHPSGATCPPGYIL